MIARLSGVLHKYTIQSHIYIIPESVYVCKSALCRRFISMFAHLVLQQPMHVCLGVWLKPRAAQIPSALQSDAI